MASGVTTRFRGDTKDLERAHDRAAEGPRKLGEEYRNVSREAREARRIAVRAMREQETATERYRRELQTLNRAVNRGSITQEQHRRAVRQVAREYRNVDEAQESTFSGLDSSIGTAITNFTSLAAIIGTIGTTLSAAAEDAERIAQANRDASFGLAELAQLEATVPGFRGTTAEARDVFASAATETLDAAARFVFRAQSAQLSQADRDLFEGIGTARFSSDLAGLIEATRRVQVATGGRAGDAEDVLARGLATSVNAQANLNEILSATARSAQAATRAGITIDELLGAIPPIVDTAGAREGATVANAFFAALAKSGLEFETLDEAIDKTRRAIDEGRPAETFTRGIRDPEDRRRTLAEARRQGLVSDPLGGRDEAIRGLEILEANREVVRRVINEVQAAAADSGAFLEQRIGLTRADPTVDATIRNQQAQNIELIARENEGNVRLISEANLALANAIQAERGDSALSIAFADRLRRLDLFLFGSTTGLPASANELNALRIEAERENNERLLAMVNALEENIRIMNRLIESNSENARVRFNRVVEPETQD